MAALLLGSVIGMLRLYVVSDHDVTREGLLSVLASDADIRVVGHAGYAGDLIGRIGDSSADVVIVDHSPPHGDGIRLCRDLSDAGVGARIVLLMDTASIDAAGRARGAGARACLARDVRSDRLIAAVRAAGDDAPDPASADAGREGMPALSRSQTTVLRLLVEGMSVAEIAEATGFSRHTVRSYLRDVYRRLGVGSRAEAVAVAIRLRLL